LKAAQMLMTHLLLGELDKTPPKTSFNSLIVYAFPITD